eukprot:jgi/Bigna1/84672/fgenesh1_pg.203_\
MSTDAAAEKRAKQLRIAMKVREEIISTEQTYVDQLNSLIEVYVKPLRGLCAEAKEKKKAPPLELKEMRTLFGSIEQIFGINKNFLGNLKKEKEEAAEGKGVGAIFKDFAPYFKMYTDYVGNHDRATALLEKIQKTGGRKYSAFKGFKEQKERTVLLAGLLILPIQRVPRYRLLLQELVNRTEETHPEYPVLCEALELVKDSANHINEAVKRMDGARKVRAIQEKFIAGTHFVSPSRIFKKEGQATKLSDGNRYRQKYHFVLFNNLFLYADTQKLSGKYKVHWQSDIKSDFDLREKEDNPNSRYRYQFEIITKAKTFTMVFKDPSEKKAWKEKICESMEECKSNLNFERVDPPEKDNKLSTDSMIAFKRPKRPSPEAVKTLFDLHDRLEKVLVVLYDKLVGG